MRQERERRGWTLDYIARQVGVSSAQISRIESEGVRSAETAQAIASLLDLPLDDICSNPARKRPVQSAPAQLQEAS
jgi:transcriptional regulator with XRE-family HTH domain